MKSYEGKEIQAAKIAFKNNIDKDNIYMYLECGDWTDKYEDNTFLGNIKGFPIIIDTKTVLTLKNSQGKGYKTDTLLKLLHGACKESIVMTLEYSRGNAYLLLLREEKDFIILILRDKVIKIELKEYASDGLRFLKKYLGDNIELDRILIAPNFYEMHLLIKPLLQKIAEDHLRDMENKGDVI